MEFLLLKESTTVVVQTNDNLSYINVIIQVAGSAKSILCFYWMNDIFRDKSEFK